ncbi:arsenic resistance protein [Desmospora activa]|uniref:arsenic resistance protein n=1 Tax=Desmospora activa TaxID=500615 RepID=UPI000D326F8D|nr:bile acid:sodium symporter [Desmospora activa]
MGVFERAQPLLILGAVLLGLLMGQDDSFSLWMEWMILPFLMVMLVGVFLQVPLKVLRNAFGNVTFTLASVVINFVITPLVAGGLGFLFLRDTPELWIGFTMLMVTPCTDWYLVFTSISKGNVALSTTLLPLNLILQLLLLPFYLWLLTGRLHQLNLGLLFESVILVLVVPWIAAMLIRWMVHRYRGEQWFQEQVLSSMGTVQLLFLNLAIVAMFASQGSVLLQNPGVLLGLILPVLLYFLLIFLLGYGVARSLRLSYADQASLQLTTLARNSPIALAIALTAFPDQPLIALALVIGPLIELPVLILISRILLGMRRKREKSFA